MAVSKKARRPAGRAPATPPVSSSDARIARLRELVAVLEGSTLNELSYEDSDVAVTLVRAPRGGHTTVTTAHAPVPVAVAAPAVISSAVSASSAAADSDLITIKSPFVGTFYRAPKPGMPNFTDVGERVHRGKTLCIIEAMKLMNEIESEVDGTIAEIVAENGHAVQYGDALFRIRKA